MIFQPDRYLLKKQVYKYAHYIRGIVLDAGSGNGNRYRSFFKFERYITLDINSSSRPDIIGSVENLPLGNASIDSIVCTQVLEHVKDPQQAIKEFYRVLRTGGYCLLTVPQWNELHEEPNDYFRFTKFGLEELFKEAGFKIISIEKRGGFWALNGQMQARYIIDLFNLNKNKFLKKIFTPFLWLNGKFYIWFDKLDKSQANAKHAIGWLVIARK